MEFGSAYVKFGTYICAYVYSSEPSLPHSLMCEIEMYTMHINGHLLFMHGVGWADRVISIEMFEHMKNYHLLMQKISRWIKPGGKVRGGVVMQAQYLLLRPLIVQRAHPLPEM